MSEASNGLLRLRLTAAGLLLDSAATAALLQVAAEAARSDQNLTTIVDPGDALEKHLLDSLLAAALPQVREGSGPIADVGSGVGFPGLALAAIFPERSVHLIESEKRKAAWLTRSAEHFPNVRVVPERSEDVASHDRESFSLVVARALGPPPVALELCAPLAAPDGHVLLWRAGSPDARADGAARELGLSPATVTPYAPFPGAERYFQAHRRVLPTPERYPRRPGRAAKRPLA